MTEQEKAPEKKKQVYNLPYIKALVIRMPKRLRKEEYSENFNKALENTF